MSNLQLINECYQLGDLLGLGGMGNVYKGSVAQTGQQIAISQYSSRVSRHQVREAAFSSPPRRENSDQL